MTHLLISCSPIYGIHTLNLQRKPKIYEKYPSTLNPTEKKGKKIKMNCSNRITPIKATENGMKASIRRLQLF